VRIGHRHLLWGGIVTSASARPRLDRVCGGFPCEVTQQMADRLGLDMSRVSRLCSALERKHLLARHRDAPNRPPPPPPGHRSRAAADTWLRQTWRQRHERMLAP
jgi:hypothetical protein